ncbi:MAG: tetratricopeptide repeat protein [Nitrospira sp.]|nr:tetratricopeptide repeat protein [Nitrospira sp.]
MDQQLSPSECYERGVVLKQVRMFHPAIEDFQIAAGDPHYAGKAYMQMAMCLRAIGHDEEAIVAFRQAVTFPLVSSVERCHVLYQLGQTLESLGRDAESLEVYGSLCKRNPEFFDVAQRIQRLSADKCWLSSWVCDWWRALRNGVRARRRAVLLHMPAVLDG